MALQPDNPSLVFIPIEQASIPPKGLIVHFKDHWWSHHPEKGLIFYQGRPGKFQKSRRRNLAPQCNPVESTARYLCKKMYPWAEVIQVPSVFLKYYEE